MSYTPTARAGSLRRQHHGGDGVGAGFGQVTISSESVPQFSHDAAIASLSTPSSTGPSTTAYTTPSKGGGSSSLTITPQKDITASFAQSTMPGWAASAQVPGYQQSNAPMYIAIGGGIVLLGIIIIASRRPAKATANTRRRKRARRRRS